MIHALDDLVPAIHADAWVAPGAHVMGRVTLAAGVGIWFGAVLRGDNEPIAVGEGTNIQENSVLHTDWGYPLTIGRDCTIGHKAMLHGCTIGDGTLVGIQAVVLNEAKIGRRCIVGAGAVVTEGKEFPDGSLIVGSPARVLRTLSEQQFEMLRRMSNAYVAQTRHHRTSARRIG